MIWPLFRFSFLILCLCTACSQPTARPSSSEFEGQKEQMIRDLLRRAGHELRSGKEDSLLRAQSHYELILELLPFEPRALDGLGCIAFRLGRNLAAEWYFKKAYEKNPAYDRSLEHLATLQLRLGDVFLAESLYRKAIAINPLNYRARNNLSLLLNDSQAPESEKKGEGIRQLLKAEVLFFDPAPEFHDQLLPLRANIMLQLR